MGYGYMQQVQVRSAEKRALGLPIKMMTDWVKRGLFDSFRIVRVSDTCLGG